MNAERRQRVARRVALALGAVSIVCLLGAVLALALRPRQFTTHRDAIGAALVQRGITYEVIYINRTWPDTLTDEVYGAQLDVRLPGGRSVPGRLECRVRRTDCYFHLASLGIERQPLPELVEEREWPAWLVWLAARLNDIR